jgi:hypothetical protein
MTNTVTDNITLIRGHIKDPLKTDGQDAFVYKNSSVFRLSEAFINASSIAAYKNGVQLDSQDYTFDSDKNDVTISFVTSGLNLALNDVIVITYSYYGKFSDTELEGYIKSSLTYFVQHRYHKIFEVNDDSEIVSVNEVNPTTEELYFISIIASILIDPQNIDIKIDKNFSITKNRDQSDQEQIAEAFSQFKNWVGEVSWEEEE